MNPGELKQRLIFKIPSSGVDEDGFPIETPQVYTKAWGKLKTLKGHTRFLAAQSQMEHQREFIIRYQRILSDGIRPKELYFLWNGKKHKIVSIEDDDGLNKTMTIYAKAVS